MATKKLPSGIRLRGDRYFVDVSIKGTRKTSTCDTYEEALTTQARLRTDILAKLNGDVKDHSSPAIDTSKGDTKWTLKDAVDKTLNLPAPEGWKNGKCEKTSMINIKFALDYFGSTCLITNINVDTIDGFMEHLGKRGDSNGTINRKLAALSKVLTVAQRRSRGRYHKPEFPRRLPEAKGRIRQLSSQEEQMLVAYYTRLGDGDAIDATHVLLDTGMRLSELFSIRQTDVTPEGILLIHGRDAKGTKNGEFRSVPMTKRVSEILTRRINLMVTGDNPFPWNRHWYTRKWNRMRDHLGFNDDPQFIPHMLRHTCASRLVQRGVSLKVVQEWMGHKTIQITMRYAHLYPKDLFAARDALEQ